MPPAGHLPAVVYQPPPNRPATSVRVFHADQNTSRHLRITCLQKTQHNYRLWHSEFLQLTCSVPCLPPANEAVDSRLTGFHHAQISPAQQSTDCDAKNTRTRVQATSQGLYIPVPAVNTRPSAAKKERTPLASLATPQDGQRPARPRALTRRRTPVQGSPQRCLPIHPPPLSHPPSLRLYHPQVHAQPRPRRPRRTRGHADMLTRHSHRSGR